MNEETNLKYTIEIRKDKDGNYYEFRYIDTIDKDEQVLVERVTE